MKTLRLISELLDVLSNSEESDIDKWAALKEAARLHRQYSLLKNEELPTTTPNSERQRRFRERKKAAMKQTEDIESTLNNA